MAKQAAVPTEPKAANKTRKKTVRTSSIPGVPGMLREPSHTEIAEHAYALYLARGAHEGDELSDWTRAERELRAPR
jgi:hypothetical protein